MFVHTVYFWMNANTGAAAAKQLGDDCRQYLSQVPSVRQLWAGPPAKTPRDVVDNSYGVGLTVVFDDKAGHDLYQDHPLHLEFIQRNKTHWRRVQVYDYLPG